MEMQYFVHPKEAGKWFDYWQEQRMKWYLGLGMKKENIKFSPHQKHELAHYAKQGMDVVFKFPFGENEIEGIHNRGDWDLSQHSKYSGQELKYKDDNYKEPFYPYVIETSGGIDRSALAFLLNAYEEVKGGRTTTTESNKEVEVVLRLHKDLAPYKVAVLPLSKKPELSKLAKDIYASLCLHFMATYDDVASIGRRYRRQDEIGTPYAITVDFESLADKKVTVRDRDTMKQDRVFIKELVSYLQNKLT
jgi:glycyl-tRNA synthetase